VIGDENNGLKNTITASIKELKINLKISTAKQHEI